MVVLERHTHVGGYLRVARFLTQLSFELTNTAATQYSPEGTRLLGDGPVPALTFRNIYILPGIPQFFVAQLELVRSLFSGKSPTLHRLYLRAEECDIAELLGRVQRDLPSVKIGSYPRFGDPSYSVLVTVEGSDAGQVQTALTELITRLPEDRLLRVESGEE